MTIKQLFERCGYLIDDKPHDTRNIVCKRGHIYEDRGQLVVSMDNATAAESRTLRRLGTVVADGDFGELTVRFPITKFRDVSRLVKPRYAILHAA